MTDNSKRLKTKQNRKSEPSQRMERTRRGKGRVGAAVKQKGMSTVEVTDGAGSCLSVEEKIASGSISIKTPKPAHSPDLRTTQSPQG